MRKIVQVASSLAEPVRLSMARTGSPWFYVAIVAAGAGIPVVIFGRPYGFGSFILLIIGAISFLQCLRIATVTACIEDDSLLIKSVLGSRRIPWQDIQAAIHRTILDGKSRLILGIQITILTPKSTIHFSP